MTAAFLRSARARNPFESEKETGRGRRLSSKHGPFRKPDTPHRKAARRAALVNRGLGRFSGSSGVHPGFRALHWVGPCVCIFGSARFQEVTVLRRRRGWGAASRRSVHGDDGRRSRIMEAANRGAQDAGGLHRLQHRAADGRSNPYRPLDAPSAISTCGR
jgi:hypothetical protein